MTAQRSATPKSNQSRPGTGATSVARRASRRRAVTTAPRVGSAVVLVTVPADGGGPAAALPWEGSTILRRLLEQLASVGVPAADVIVRPEWQGALAPSLDVGGISVALHPSPDPATDLRTLAAVARSRGGGIVLLPGEIVTHREALAGLLLDPRLRTAVLAGAGARARPFAPRIRSLRGRVLSASSTYHVVARPTANFLSVLKVAAAERALLADAAEQLAELAASPPGEWMRESEARVALWRRWYARRSDPEREIAPDENPALPAEEEEEVQRWVAAAEHDLTGLVLVGLVRRGAVIGNSHLRGLFWARPLSPAAAAEAAREIQDHDEDRVLLDAAVKGNDGFFTTFFVSPYSKYLARWAAHRGWTPNGVTTLSVLIGALAGAAFATGSQTGMVVGAILLQASFTTDCVDGQLARYTRQFSALGAWLDSVFDRTKEYIVFAGLAIGASRTGDDVWLLACAALALQTVRHTLEFSYAAGRQQAFAAVLHPPLAEPYDTGAAARAAARLAPEPAVRPKPEPRSLVRRALFLWTALERLPGVRWAKKIIAFPIGERFALISVAAVLGGPRTTFVIYLAWAALATAYNLVGRVLRSVAR